MKTNEKKALLFTVAILPFAVIGTIFTCLYQFDLYDPSVLEPAIEQLGSRGVLVAISVAQVAIYAFVCGLFGSLLAQKVGLWKPFRVERRAVLFTLAISVVMGILFSLDYWTFGKVLPVIMDSYADGMTLYGVLASVFYGGIIEEVMMRLFLMSLVAFLLWKIFYSKTSQENIPDMVFVAANIVAALLFAAGHLPATAIAFGELKPLILFRCFLFNGGFGLVFGRIYRKFGIHYAMLSHITVHVVSKLIWAIFI